MSQMPEDTGYGGLPYVMSGLPRRRNPYDQRRQMAYGMLQGGMDMSPVAHPLQGASRLAQALVGSLMMGKIDSDEAAADKQRQEAFGKAMETMQSDPQAGLAMLGKIDPETGVRMAAQVAQQRIKREEDAKAFQSGGNSIFSAYGMQPQGAPQGPQQAALPPEQAKATAQQYVQYLVQNHGFKPEEAAQMVGNLYQESGFNPTALHDNGTGFGLGGWRLDRRDALLKAAQEQGRDPRDPQFQLDFYATELKNRPEYQQFQQAQTPEQRQAALMTYFRPAGWTPQTPQAGHGFGARLQYGQMFAGPGVPQQAAAGGQPPLPVPQPPGGAPQGPQMPAPPEVPRPQPSPELLGRAQQMYQSGMFGKDPQAALAGARQWVEQQLESEWARSREGANRNWQMQREDARAQQEAARKAPKEQFDSATTLRKEYSSEPVVKQYRTVVPMLETAKDAVSRPSRAADINLVYAFAKLMDPDSVVRESETGMVMATGTVADKLGSYLGQLNGGPMLKPETRANLIRELESRFGPMQESYTQITDAYGKIADSAGLPRDHVILPIRATKAEPAVPGAGPAQGAVPPPPPGFRPIGGR